MRPAVCPVEFRVAWMFLAAMVALSFALSGCEYDSAFADIRCETNDECPSGSVCSEGFCTSESADAGDIGDDAEDTVVTVEITPSTLTLGAGDSARLEAVAQLADGTEVPDAELTWTSSDPEVVDVNDEGGIAALAEGSALVTAESGFGSGSAAITVTARPVATVTISPAPATLEQGSTLQLSTDVFAANGDPLDGRTTRWSIDDTTIATVDSSGILRGNEVGMTTVTAEVGGVSADATVEVTEADVAQITLLPSSAVIEVGQIFSINALLRDSGGRLLEGRSPTWSSEDDTIATVNDSGEVEGIAEGSTTITASADGTEATATIDVRPVEVATLDVSPSAASLEVGSTLALTATAFSGGGNELTGRNVTWSSSDDTVATVDNNGEVTAASAGTVLISANIGNIQASAALTVVPSQPDQITVNPTSVDVTVGASTDLSVEVRDASGDIIADPSVAWNSDDEATAVVDSNGTVVARAVGNATVTASANGNTATVSVNVLEKSVDTVQVIPSNASIEVGQTLDLRVEARASDGTLLEGRTVSWTPADDTVADVDSSGSVTGIAAGGPVDITASVEGITGSSAITVIERPVTSVDVTPRSTTLTSQQTEQLSATPRAADGTALTGRTITWSSTDTNVATVDSSGLVTADQPGLAVIEAEAGGTIGYASVRVEAPSVANVTISPSNPSLTVGNTAMLTATVEDASGNVLTGRTVQWTTSDATVVGVESGGTIVGISQGAANVTATVEGVTDTVSIDVNPVPVDSVDVTPASPSIDIGETVQLEATAFDAQGNVLEGRTFAWTSTSASVATVDSNGLVTGETEGSSTIRATASGSGVVGTTSVTVSWRFGGVSASLAHACAVSTNDVLYCWGDNAAAQLGDGTTTDQNVATPVSTDVVLVRTAAGHDHSCGLDSSGKAYCWGDNAFGQLGDGSFSDSREPVPVDTMSTYQSMDAGDGFTCGLTSMDRLECWGQGSDGQLGDGNSGAGTTANTPVEVQLAYNDWIPREVSVGRRHACALTEATGDPSDVRVFCWGDNAIGQLGDNSNSDSATPVEVDHNFGQDTARDVAAGGDNGCMVVEAGNGTLSAECWGDNTNGQVGDASTDDRNDPRPVDGGFEFDSVWVGIDHACGLLAGGGAKCWGDNSDGQLGDGSSGGFEDTPVDVAGSLTLTAMALGDDFTCAIAGDDTLYCWGDATDGRIGLGGTGAASDPTPVVAP